MRSACLRHSGGVFYSSNTYPNVVVDIVSTQFMRGSLTKSVSVPLAGLKKLMASCSALPW